ncbi:tetratricopeptide repeat protein 33 isoform X2 [Mobula birostris]|uniref:tetratricopeptide repeat protein 33 isoform X2 n=1 Tax=Mobula birostris TaxID=1983395 RepID=UPI003B27EBC7
MTSFGWKRKVGEKVSKAASQVFEEAAEDGGLVDSDVDWLHAAKRRRETLLEDCAVKSKRLKDEGVFLSENGRYWEAIGRWDEAIQLTPDCAALYEMKAQALRSFQQAVHTFPAESSLWEDDLGWAVELRRRQRELNQAAQQRQAPADDLPDYDFESEELVEACAAIAERDRQPCPAGSPVYVAAPGNGAGLGLQARGFVQAR